MWIVPQITKCISSAATTAPPRMDSVRSTVHFYWPRSTNPTEWIQTLTAQGLSHQGVTAPVFPCFPMFSHCLCSTLGWGNDRSKLRCQRYTSLSDSESQDLLFAIACCTKRPAARESDLWCHAVATWPNETHASQQDPRHSMLSHAYTIEPQY